MAPAAHEPPVPGMPPQPAPQAKIDVAHLNFFYGTNRALDDITLKILSNQVTALIGPSGCGKSTFLRSLNRMNDIVPGTRVEGSIQIDGKDINLPSVDVVDLRRRVGMVFQKSNPFPKSISSLRRCGTRSAIGSTRRRSRCRAGSSSGCASRGRWRSSRRFC